MFFSPFINIVPVFDPGKIGWNRIKRSHNSIKRIGMRGSARAEILWLEKRNGSRARRNTILFIRS